ncbi:hypothetical protein BVRB_6g141610 [Beta vulgaris subsp. vulgaris]|nr:hypothetical protein BVRB_6g141610 [Beta vulgaris subsp. vulgaris]
MSAVTRGSSTSSKAVLFVLMIIVMGTMIAEVVECGRGINQRWFEDYSALEGRLPKGLVPPSGPSPCHDMKFNADKYAAHINDYVMCP